MWIYVCKLAIFIVIASHQILIFAIIFILPIKLIGWGRVVRALLWSISLVSWLILLAIGKVWIVIVFVVEIVTFIIVWRRIKWRRVAVRIEVSVARWSKLRRKWIFSLVVSFRHSGNYDFVIINPINLHIYYRDLVTCKFMNEKEIIVTYLSTI